MLAWFYPPSNPFYIKLLSRRNTMNTEARLESISPHLDATLRRVLSEDDVKECRSIFEITILNHGLKELDFERDPETSYNPRVARIPLILIKESKRFSADSVKASILYSAGDSLLDDKAYRAIDNENIKHILSKSKLNIEKLCALSQDSQLSIEIALSGQLDRLRHLHQAQHPQRLIASEVIHNEAPYWIKLAKQCNSLLFPLINHWYTHTALRILT